MDPMLKLKSAKSPTRHSDMQQERRAVQWLCKLRFTLNFKPYTLFTASAADLTLFVTLLLWPSLLYCHNTGPFVAQCNAGVHAEKQKKKQKKRQHFQQVLQSRQDWKM